MIGKTISHYEILEKLGAGGMGEVYKARDTSLDRLVALKFLKPHIDDDESARKRFVHEAKAASALDHRSVGTIYEIGQTGDGRTFIAMAYYGGESLADEIKRGPLALTRALDIAIAVGEGLAEAHRHDIVHRDVKPGNVIITDRGEAKLVDFGLAKLAGQTKLTKSGTTVGTIGYMSPEQAQGREVDRRADVWALGALLYESLVCHPPFHGAHEQAIVYSIINVDPEPLTAQRAGLPLEIDRVVGKALAKDPAQRFQSVDDMIVDLRELRAEAKSSSGKRAAGVAVTRRSRARGALLVGAGVVVGIAVGIGASKWLFSPADVEPPRVRIVTNSGSDRHPTASPDGKTIAFASARSGVSQIWLKQLSTGNEVAITEGNDVNPRFSPDGLQLLFARNEGGRKALWRVPIVGGQARRLMDDATEGAWSPDGSQLAFLRSSNEGGGVWLAGADGSNPRRIHREDVVGMRGVSWSPNGLEILVVVADPFGNVPTRLLIVSTQGDSARTVDPGARFAQTGTPVWLGSGDRIAYALVEALSTTATGQVSRVVERSLETGKVNEVVSLPMACRDLAVLGPGRLLLGFGQQSQNLVLVEEPGTARVREKWLTRGGSVDRQPVFSPDGRRVLFSSNRSGNLDLWEIDLQTSAMKRLTDDPGQDWDPAYTPDGRGILWSSDRTGNFEIWLADADGSDARQISRDGVGAENPAMSADGAWIVYSSYRRSVYDLWKMRADGSEPQLFLNDRSMAATSMHPNIFAAGMSTARHVDRSLRVYRLDDGTPWPGEIVFARSFDILTGRPTWVGSNRIAWVDCTESGLYGVMICDVSETGMGASRPLAGFDPLAPTETFDVSNDGKRAILSVRNSLLTIAVAENVPGIDVSGKRGGR
jgi:eukaryotic-like serine/threonine-protein kinase